MSNDITIDYPLWIDNVRCAEKDEQHIPCAGWEHSVTLKVQRRKRESTGMNICIAVSIY